METEVKLPTLMLVEDPRETIETLCNVMDNNISWKDFKIAYEYKTNRINKPVSRGTTDTHFYTLTQFGLLTPVEESPNYYKISLLGKKICQSLNKKDKKEYQNKLKNILLNNEKKGILFKMFVDTINKNKIIKKFTLMNIFRPVTTRALIAWCIEANMINYDKDTEQVWLKKDDLKMQLNIDNFWELLKSIYYELRKTDIFMIDQIFVDISELRAITCMETGWELSEFDTNLRKILKTKYGQKIRLYGAPSSAYENKQNFQYNGKLYVFIRIKE